MALDFERVLNDAFARRQPATLAEREDMYQTIARQLRQAAEKKGVGPADASFIRLSSELDAHIRAFEQRFAPAEPPAPQVSAPDNLHVSPQVGPQSEAEAMLWSQLPRNPSATLIVDDTRPDLAPRRDGDDHEIRPVPHMPTTEGQDDGLTSPDITNPFPPLPVSQAADQHTKEFSMQKWLIIAAAAALVLGGAYYASQQGAAPLSASGTSTTAPDTMAPATTPAADTTTAPATGDGPLFAADTDLAFTVRGAVSVDGPPAREINLLRLNGDPAAAEEGSGAYIGLNSAVEAAVAGNRIRVTITARKAEDNGADGFSAAYFTLGNGNSGWQTFTPTAEFADYSFEYDAPALPAGDPGSDTIGIIPSTTGQGSGIEVRSIVVDKLQ